MCSQVNQSQTSEIYMNHENVQEYINMLSSDDISTIFDDAVNLIDAHSDTALEMFHDRIRAAAHCMQNTVVVRARR